MRLDSRSVLAVALSGLALTLAACAAPLAGDYPTGGTYYTQFTVQQEKDRYRTTNYRRGIVVPINTEVELKSINRKRATVLVKSSGRELVVENISKHTGKDMGAAFEQMFGAEPVDLAGYDDEQKGAIQRGEVLEGMHKSAVLLAYGPPPVTGTPSLDSSAWKYWSSRWSTFLVTFDEAGVVTDPGI